MLPQNFSGSIKTQVSSPVKIVKEETLPIEELEDIVISDDENDGQRVFRSDME
jgi:hypothetical protein